MNNNNQNNTKPMQINTPQQQNKDDKLQEKREEEKRQAENQLLAFDAYGFYDKLGNWSVQPTPKPTKEDVRVSLWAKKESYRQPLPLTRGDHNEVKKLSKGAARLLQLLRIAEQRGVECPYIHTQSRQEMIKASERCRELLEAAEKFTKARGLKAYLNRILHSLHMNAAKKDLQYFKARLDAIANYCRQLEFARDISMGIKVKQYPQFDTGAKVAVGRSKSGAIAAGSTKTAQQPAKPAAKAFPGWR